jgi:hypothetical protein
MRRHGIRHPNAEQQNLIRKRRRRQPAPERQKLVNDLPRVLPIPLAPLHGELLGSYLNRLADANHLTITALTWQIGPGRYHRRDSDNPTGWTPDAIARLAALRYALPALRHVTALPFTIPPAPIEEVIASWRAPACLLCAARRGVHGLAILHAHPHQRICLRHGRWHGGGDQRPLSSVLPDVLHANVRHRRLVRSRDALTVGMDYLQAQALTSSWLTSQGPTDLQHRWHRRLDLLGEDPYGDPHRPSADRIELVTLTSQIGSNPSEAAERLTNSRAHLTGTAQSNEDRADFPNPAWPPLKR